MNNSLFSKRIAQQIERFGYEIAVRRFDKSRTDKDSIYLESKAKKYLPDVGITAIVIFNPTEEVFLETGLDKNNTEVVVKVARNTLLRKGLLGPDGTLFITQDDVLVIEGIEYPITKVNPLVQFKQNLMFAMSGKRVK